MHLHFVYTNHGFPWTIHLYPKPKSGIQSYILSLLHNIGDTNQYWIDTHTINCICINIFPTSLSILLPFFPHFYYFTLRFSSVSSKMYLMQISSKQSFTSNTEAVYTSILLVYLKLHTPFVTLKSVRFKRPSALICLLSF